MLDVELKYEDVENEPPSAKSLIRRLLERGFRNDPDYYKESDKRLILKVWQHEGLILTPEQRQKFLHEVTTPDAITRTRRSLVRRGRNSKDSLVKRIRNEAR